MERYRVYGPVTTRWPWLNDPKYSMFRPNLTPIEVMQSGAFEGAYWRPINSKVTGMQYTRWWVEFQDFVDLCVQNRNNLNLFEASPPNVKINRYGVKSGSPLEEWDEKGWIHPQDPYGWFQWYCRFYYGRRTDDDDIQIKRWLRFAGPKGRFKLQLINKIKTAGTTCDDVRISPVTRQGLLHWAYQLVPEDIV